MPTESLHEAARKTGGASLILEIGLKTGEVPLRIPVMVQNYSAGVLTLKVAQSLGWVEWENLSGQESLLRLPAPGPGTAEAISGKVSWIKQSGSEGTSVFLGMDLAQPTPQVQKVLEEEILQTPKDIKGLWQQWDQVQVKTRRSTVRAWFTLGLGVVLMAAGGGILNASGRFPPMYGYGAVGAGAFLTLIAGIWFWRRRRV